MITKKTKPFSEIDLQKNTEQYLSNLKAKDEQEFNRQLKEQLDDLITAITDSLPSTPEQDEEVRQTVQKHINSFWQRYKKREGAKPDSVAKRLTAEFKDYFVSLTFARITPKKIIHKPSKPPIKKLSR
jgi:site-specific recombinase XerC